ncbi:hypothetical protein SAMN04487944_115129 [Gracilibacillus ureilyticus]|uniref:Uncharacterized protein n=1 Tax=Gracilibacillus ureilyticus TaxID=531814 RepID=A0A1H9U0S2_9BACI|nr:hypothetical protein [Gracilibacillus ureilyticus]SES03220.1 hypothetical protein SAMN04487944_115129 [Gracilibacillus ureilyticus]
MIRRKLITTLLATPLSLLIIFGVFFGEWKQPVELVIMTVTFGLWVSPFILLYGVPVTFLSDFATKRLRGGKRTITAFFIHLCFGILFGFIFPMGIDFSLIGIKLNLASISAMITALFFWGIDELLRRKKVKSKVIEKLT